MKIFENEAAAYSIVIPQNYENSEKRCAIRLAAMLGITGEILTDDKKADLEILVGKTNRTKTAVGKAEFAVATYKHGIEIVADNCFVYEYALDYCKANLEALLAEAKQSAGVLYREDTSAKLRAAKDPSILDRSGEIRLLYHNVWGWDNGPAPQGWINGKSEPSQRSRAMAETHKTLAPDVICLQEYTNFLMRSCEDSIVAELEKTGDYAEVKLPPVDKIETATPIIYNTKTVKLIDSGVHKFTFGGGMDKFLTWGVFETVAKGKKFGVISGHLAYQGGEDGNMYRMCQIPLMMYRAERIKSTHKCPVFFGGDMNCPGFSAPYRLFLNMGAVDTWPLSEITEDRSTCHAYPDFDQETGLVMSHHRVDVYDAPTYMQMGIDHIFVLPRGEKPKFRRFDIVSNVYANTGSDHMPVVLDLDLN